jgi:3-dehydroquinate dehydratase I
MILMRLLSGRCYLVNPPRICIPLVSTSQVGAPAVAAVTPLADFFEVRIDLIGAKWRQVIPALDKPWIACNRRTEEGGKWKGAEAKRIKELLSALDLGASFVDVELDSPGIQDVVKEVKGRAQLIVSYHNLQETPPVDRLRQIVINELAAGADICKVVTTARNFNDNIAVLELISAFPDAKIISFAMGPAGQVSRVLSPLVGGYLTWASAAGGGESAPGQITVEEVTKIYRMLGNS